MKQYYTIDRQGRTVMPCNITKQWEIKALELVADHNGFIPYDDYNRVMNYILSTQYQKRKQN